ncbi:MAG: glucose-6-phosphate dehydrogenase, partial [Verrucomicrobiota bacterium]
QNHLLQLLCLVGMEPPSNMTADAIRNAKTELLQGIKPFTPERIRSQAVRAQYKGYREEDRVAPDSKTAAFCALKLEIENWRWAGVPFYLRTGKRMQTRVTEIAVQFKMPPLQLFKTVQCEGDVCDLTRANPNVLTFRIQPDEGIALHFSAKRPAMQLVVENVDMSFSYADTWERSLQEAYERLLIDVMRGDPTLFTRSDEVEAAWSVVDPILELWESDADVPVHAYEPGSWGPAAADELLQKNGHAWRNE